MINTAESDSFDLRVQIIRLLIFDVRKVYRDTKNLNSFYSWLVSLSRHVTHINNHVICNLKSFMTME